MSTLAEVRAALDDIEEVVAGMFGGWEFETKDWAKKAKAFFDSKKVWAQIPIPPDDNGVVVKGIDFPKAKMLLKGTPIWDWVKVERAV